VNQRAVNQRAVKQTDAERALHSYVSLRSRLFQIAYRLLGSVSDADDVVQDTWIRWERAAPDAASHEAVLVTITTRLALDRLRADRRRAQHVGPWLPEPLIESARTAVPNTGRPEDRALGRESLGMAFLLLLERLSPLERAVLVLHDVFGYPHPETAAMIGISPAASRQHLSRARRTLRDHRRNDLRAAHETALVSEQSDDVVERFIVAALTGDVSTAVSLCSPAVRLISDGGAHRHAARRVVTTPHRVTRLWSTISRRSVASGATADVVVANGRPAMIRRLADGTADAVIVFEADAGALESIYVVLDPHKLRHLAAPPRTWRARLPVT
jgi:RNA polymerase sigma-70 factor, ECF subfamily